MLTRVPDEPCIIKEGYRDSQRRLDDSTGGYVLTVDGPGDSPIEVDGDGGMQKVVSVEPGPPVGV